MGWDFITGGLPYGQTADQYLRSQCDYERETPEGKFSCHILKSAFVGTTWYAAAHCIHPARDGHEARDVITVRRNALRVAWC